MDHYANELENLQHALESHDDEVWQSAAQELTAAAYDFGAEELESKLKALSPEAGWERRESVLTDCRLLQERYLEAGVQFQ